MKIEYFYNENGKATMELDAEALRMVLNYMAAEINTINETQLIDAAKCIGELAKATEQIEEDMRQKQEEEQRERNEHPEQGKISFSAAWELGKIMADRGISLSEATEALKALSIKKAAEALEKVKMAAEGKEAVERTNDGNILI